MSYAWNREDIEHIVIGKPVSDEVNHKIWEILNSDDVLNQLVKDRIKAAYREVTA